MDKSTGAIVVARIMRGGAADKSGKLIKPSHYTCVHPTHIYAVVAYMYLPVTEKSMCYKFPYAFPTL